MVNSQTLEKLSTVLRPVTDEQDANTAVAIILKESGNDFEILLVRRTHNPKDPWSGQMALPGGKREAKDDDLKDTVIRETFEETGIELRDSRFLGVTSALKIESKSNLRILPFVTVLKREQEIKLCCSELETYVWMTVEKIVQSRGRIEIMQGEVSAFILEKGIVWGITYQILNDFFDAIRQVSE